MIIKSDFERQREKVISGKSMDKNIHHDYAKPGFFVYIIIIVCIINHKNAFSTKTILDNYIINMYESK